MTAMAALYRKDWRVYRAAAVGGIALLLLPYLGAAAEILWWDDRWGWSVSDVLMRAAFMGLTLTVVTAAVFGGAAFAAERRDRSAEFLAAIPVSRPRAARSKLRVALTFLVAAWAVHAFCIVSAALSDSESQPLRYSVQAFNILWNTTSVAVMAFGVAWMVSSFVSSPAIAATAGLALTLVTLVLTIDLARPQDDAYHLLSAIEFIEGSPRVATTLVGPISVQALGRLVMWAAGTCAWCAGTAVYVRRVTP